MKKNSSKIIPLFDLSRQSKKIKKNIIADIKKALDTNEFTFGTATEKFEQDFAKLCKTNHALAVHSGTDALILSLKSLDTGKGDEVITTPCSFSASTDCIVHTGATPVFADVFPDTGNINPQEIQKKITNKTKAILLVHLYGVPCEMDEILAIAKKHKLFVIEDASHAHGSLYKGKPVGSFGELGCFSLYPSKSLGAIGNAGIITTNSINLYNKIKMLANHGIKNQETKYTHHLSGFNKLIDNLQSIALIHKFPELPKTIAKKKEVAETYNSTFQKIGMPGMVWHEYTSPSIYVYAFQTKNRSSLQKYFEENSVSTGIYYPVPLHLQPSMKFLGYKKGNLPNAEKFFAQTLSLPIFSELKKSEISHIVKVIKRMRTFSS